MGFIRKHLSADGLHQLVRHCVVCWKRFEKFSAGHYSTAGLSWMFCKSKMAWGLILQANVIHLFSAYNIKSGVLVIDDSDKERSYIPGKTRHYNN